MMREKLAQLEENLRVLSSWSGVLTVEKLKQDKQAEWALRYGFFETIQIVIDIACSIVARQNLGKPKSYVSCVELLQKSGYLDSVLTEHIVAMIGLRNLLVHEYTDIDMSRLLGFLDQLEDVRKFLAAVKEDL